MKTSAALQHLVDLMINADNPSMVVMIGVPGVGKTTLINKLRENAVITVGSTDDLIEARAAKVGKTYSEIFPDINHKYLTKEMVGILENAIKNREHCVVDRTNMGRKSRKQWISMAPDYQKIALNFTVADNVLFARLDARAKATGKFIPKHVIQSMFNNYDRPTREEGFDHVIEVDNT